MVPLNEPFTKGAAASGPVAPLAPFAPAAPVAPTGPGSPFFPWQLNNMALTRMTRLGIMFFMIYELVIMIFFKNDALVRLVTFAKKWIDFVEKKFLFYGNPYNIHFAMERELPSENPRILRRQVSKHLNIAFACPR